jgi:hypothetical protein
VRGFFLGALILIGLDLATKAPASRIAQLASTPAAWLAAWMDPHTPLISKPVPGSSSTPASTKPAVNAQGLTTVAPVNGVCPTGFTMIGGQCVKVAFN